MKKLVMTSQRARVYRQYNHRYHVPIRCINVRKATKAPLVRTREQTMNIYQVQAEGIW